MFTGLIEEIGKIASIRPECGQGIILSVTCDRVARDTRIGGSIAINGCCLTVVGTSDGWLEFQVGGETLSRTNLGSLAVGNGVNLERSIRVGDRLGGHFVTGHIDCVGTLIHQKTKDDWSDFSIAVDSPYTLQMASKGSIAVDGVSLTLVDVDSDRFTVALIPHTLRETTLGERQVGDQLNIETDVLAKYVQQHLTRSETPEQP